MGRAECIAGFLIRRQDLAEAPGELLKKAVTDGDGDPWAPNFAAENADEFIDYYLLMEDIAKYLGVEWSGVGDDRHRNQPFMVYFGSSETDHLFRESSGIKLSDIRLYQPQFDELAKKLRSIGLPAEFVIHSVYHE